ncbi:hypothetical protein Sste5346_009072 [Sporothrix stenoceras]|uniref:FAD dependent oxidoreductase domain-containing protein n=1 Tax=Sporothrix stenoceras TaxID=5173 RepID=A0ABR3YLF1_9PEZI
MTDKSARVAVLGAGCWGLSTAYHLQKDGYTNITVFDRASELPSNQSAANDLNKIVRAQYSDDFYTDLGLEAIAAWKTEDWAPYFHQTGHLVMLSGYASEKAQGIFGGAANYISNHRTMKGNATLGLDTPEKMREFCWQLTGPLTNFKSYYNRAEGYAHSARAVGGIAEKLKERGVKFVLGPEAGLVEKLFFEGEGEARRCTGFTTHDGTTHNADLVVCALGAYGAQLVPQVGLFSVARCWSVAHIKLTQDECDVLRGIPVVNSMDLGFFFEPDPATRLLKLTPLGAGYSNYGSTQTSLPPLASGDTAQNTALAGYVPQADEVQMRRLLQETLPYLADRPFVEKKMCWFSDTADSEYCIDFVPNTSKSLVVLSGDSGHGFKMMPIFGSWVKTLLEDGQQKLPRWTWRNVDPAQGGADWGGDVSWRFGEAAETSAIVEERQKAEAK